MVRFDFIAADDFRSSLESNYTELTGCLATGAWKATHVLAGSIAEAVLVDYLVSINYTQADPLKMDLVALTAACRAEAIISQTTAGLTHVIREYRNLIHPGRLIRLHKSIRADGARVAKSLVDMVISDVSKNKAAKHGYTANHIIRKIQTDPSSQAVLNQLIDDAVDTELDKLVNSSLQRYYFNQEINLGNERIRSIRSCYKRAYRRSSSAIKAKACAQFVRLLKEESEDKIRKYESMFFHSEQIDDMTTADASLVKKHMIEALRQRPTERLLESLQGIETSIDKK